MEGSDAELDRGIVVGQHLLENARFIAAGERRRRQPGFGPDGGEGAVVRDVAIVCEIGREQSVVNVAKRVGSLFRVTAVIALWAIASS